MKRSIVAATLALAALTFATCGDDSESTDAEGDSEAAVYFGWMTGTEDVSAVAIEVDPADEQGRSEVRAYLCDGKGPPEGKAIWFSGAVDADATQEPGAGVTLASAGGDEDLDLNFVSDRQIQGSFKGVDGDEAQFVAYPAIDGAGIYEVTLDEDLHYTGTSTQGDELDAQADSGTNTVAGSITTANDETIDFSVHSLALATPVELSERGLPNDYSKYADQDQVPGEYVALIAPGGSFWLGRSGNVRGGSAGLNIIGLDKKC